MKTQIKELIEKATQIAHEHGWTIEWNKKTIDKKTLSVGDKISLCHSELSEALEAYRDDDIGEFSIEIADVFIRLFHLCGDLDIDIELYIVNKMELNKNRPFNHGRKNY